MIGRILPYNCKGCEKEVYKEETNIYSRCIGCDIGACKKCFTNIEYIPYFICHNCAEPMVKLQRTPEEFIKAKSRGQNYDNDNNQDDQQIQSQADS